MSDEAELEAEAGSAIVAGMPRDSADIPVPVPDLRLEKRAVRRGATIVAGVDEVGRGPLAGPVVVAAVILNRRKIPDGLNDSKVLTALAREALYEEVMTSGAIVSVVAAPTRIIQEINILHASLWAMRKAVMGLSVAPDHV